MLEYKDPGVFVAIKANDQNNNNWKFLLVKDALGDKKWMFPGGRQKLGEMPFETGIRKTKEETGLKIEMIRELGCFDLIKSRGHIILVYSHIIGGNMLCSGNGNDISSCKFWPLKKMDGRLYPAQLKLFFWAHYLIKKKLYYAGPLVFPPHWPQ